MGTKKIKRYGLIGKNLSHSFSKDYFTRKFQKENIPARYENIPLSNAGELEEFVRHSGGDWAGWNVTIPYKKEIIPLLHRLTDTARETGAVNCIRIRKGQLTGHNTDAEAFRSSLMEHIRTIHTAALILGTGGASNAVAYALRSLGIPFLKVSRFPQGITQISYRDIDAGYIRNSPLIINTTPVGMYPQTEAYPDIPYEYLNENHLVFDLIYNPKETLFLKKSRLQKALTVNGYDMLIRQAEASWEFWNEA